MTAWISQQSGAWELPSSNSISPWYDDASQSALSSHPTGTDTVTVNHPLISTVGSPIVCASITTSSGVPKLTLGDNLTCDSVTNVQVFIDTHKLESTDTLASETTSEYLTVVGNVASNYPLGMRFLATGSTNSGEMECTANATWNNPVTRVYVSGLTPAADESGALERWSPIIITINPGGAGLLHAVYTPTLTVNNDGCASIIGTVGEMVVDNIFNNGENEPYSTAIENYGVITSLVGNTSSIYFGYNIYNDGTILSITGNMSSPGYYTFVISNSGTIGTITGNISATGNIGEALDNNHGGTIDSIIGNLSATGYGGYALSNYATIDSITGDLSATGYGGSALYNDGTINSITGDLSITGDYGSALYNGGTIDSITGDLSTTGDYGSALYNDGTINSITGDLSATGDSGFTLANYATIDSIIGNISATGNIGEALYNNHGGTIDSIIGNLSATGIGGYALANYGGTIDSIIGNLSATGIGGYALANYGGTIDSIIGNLSATGYGGYALSNYATIDSITGDLSAEDWAHAFYNIGTLNHRNVTFNGGLLPTVAWVAQQTGLWENNSNHADSPWYDGGAQSALGWYPSGTDTVETEYSWLGLESTEGFPIVCGSITGIDTGSGTPRLVLRDDITCSSVYNVILYIDQHKVAESASILVSDGFAFKITDVGGVLASDFVLGVPFTADTTDYCTQSAVYNNDDTTTITPTASSTGSETGMLDRWIPTIIDGTLENANPANSPCIDNRSTGYIDVRANLICNYLPGIDNGGYIRDISGSISLPAESSGSFHSGGIFNDNIGIIADVSGVVNNNGTGSGIYDSSNTGGIWTVSGIINNISEGQGIIYDGGNSSRIVFSGTVNNTSTGIGIQNYARIGTLSGMIFNTGSGTGLENAGYGIGEISGTIFNTGSGVGVLTTDGEGNAIDLISGNITGTSGTIYEGPLPTALTGSITCAIPDLLGSNIKKGTTILGIDGTLEGKVQELKI
jgi:hypothetical protein